MLFYVSNNSNSATVGLQSETLGSPILVKSASTENIFERGIPSYSVSGTNGNTNEKIIILDDNNSLNGSQLPQFLRDPRKLCNTNFKCTVDFSSDRVNDSSIKISTMNTTRNKWSHLIGQNIPVIPNERYQLMMHMKLNNWVKWSHISIQGFNESSKKWGEISTCGYINGPLEWKEFACSVTIENNVTKIRPIFKAGWTKQEGREAITWFDNVYITKFKPFLLDQKLKAEIVYEGLDRPTSMAFLSSNEFLVLEKNKALVNRITDGYLHKISLHKAVGQGPEQGMLGIAISKSPKIYVFIYYTESDSKEVHNRLYRYEYLNNTLKNPRLLLDLPAGYHHNGGPILIGPDNLSIYLAVGDIENERYDILAHKALNNKTGLEPDGSGGILRITFNGDPIDGGILGNKYPLSLYYAYGIRESFGMSFDPVTGNLWNSENGHDAGDEINMVEPGFNSGWNKIQGKWPFDRSHIPNASVITSNPSELVDFNGKGKYHSPQFTWNQTVGPTALIFLSTDKLGKQYQNDLFVADVNNGRIYHFDLNQTRNELLLKGLLEDKIADDDRELKNIIFAGDFGLITDMDIGPDGYLYFVVYNEGRIYRIVPTDQ